MRDEQVRIRIEESKKEEWETAADELGESVAQFVRRSVNEQIRESNTGDSIDDGKLDDILNEVGGLETSIEGIRHRLQTIETELKDDPKARELETIVYGLLPDEGQLTTLPDMDGRPDSRVGENGRVVTGDPQHIAEYISYSPDLDADPTAVQVQRALDSLHEELHSVQRLGDGRHYRS